MIGGCAAPDLRPGDKADDEKQITDVDLSGRITRVHREVTQQVTRLSQGAHRFLVVISSSSITCSTGNSEITRHAWEFVQTVLM
jgi:hypothetical protein